MTGRRQDDPAVRGPGIAASPLIGELMRFGAVGVAINILFYLLYLLCTSLGAGPKTAATITYLVGVPLSFASHRRLTFRRSGRRGMGRQGFQFLLACGIAYGVNMAALHAWVDLWRYPHEIVQGLLILVLAGTLFTVQKLVIFREDGGVTPGYGSEGDS